MPPDDDRARLQARQDALVRALLADGPVPEGFEAAPLERARHLLLRKQAWVAARRCKAAPALSPWARLARLLRRRWSSGP